MYNTKQLKNGLTLLTAPIENSKTVTALVMIATGSRHESAAESGLSHFLEHMFFKGTVKRPTTMAISSALDNVGAEFNAFTSKEYTGYYVKAAAEHLDLALDVISDMLIGSVFSAEEMEREKGVIIEEINMYLDNPMLNIEDVFEDLLYGDTPAGRSTAGTKETVSSFTREQLMAYYQRQYGNSSSIIVIAGAVPADIETKIDNYFATYPTSTWVAEEKIVEAQTAPAVKVFKKETDQAHLELGVRTCGYASENEGALKVLRIALGGSMSSRLFTELRERKGLAYYVRSTNENYTDSGYFSTKAGVPVAKVEEAIKIIIGEYKKIKEELMSEEELTKIKNLVKGKTALSLEGSDEVAEWFSHQAVILKQSNQAKRGILTPEEMLAQIDKITAEDVKKLANEIFTNEKLNLAIIGPYQDDAIFKPLLSL